MTLEDVRRALRTQELDLRSQGIDALYVFGSVARGEAGPDSDVDILIRTDPGKPFSILDLVAVKERLADVLGVPADVHLHDSIHYWIREQVVAEAVRVL